MLSLIAMVLAADARPAQVCVSVTGGATPNSGFVQRFSSIPPQLGAGALLGAAVEVSYRVLPFLRLELDGGGAWVPPAVGWVPRERAVLRLLIGADAVWSVRRFELFAGLASGFSYDNLDVLNSCAGPGPCSTVDALWLASGALRVRAGADFHASDRVTVGATLAYALFGRRSTEYHWAELALRAGVAF